MRSRAYDLLGALSSASCDITHETRVRFVTGIGLCILWYLTQDTGYDLLPALCSASGDLTHWHTRQSVRFVTGIGFCIWCHHARDSGYDLLPALRSVLCDLTDETRGTTGYGHCVLHLAISQTRQKEWFVTGIGIGFYILWYHTRDRGYDLLRALSSASGNITHGTGGTIFFTELVLGSASGNSIHDTVDTICYKHCVLHLVISCTRQRVRFVTDIVLRILWHLARDRGYEFSPALCSASWNITHETRCTTCYGHWVLHLVISHTRQGLRFLTGIVFCISGNHTRDRRYDLLRAFGSLACDITHETRGTICYGHWVLHLEITHDAGGTICYGRCVLHFVISHRKERGLRFVTGIGLCFL